MKTVNLPLQTMSTVQSPWRLLTAHGAVLAYITMHPGCDSAELAEQLVVSRRTVWRLLADIKRSGVVRTRKRNRTYLYYLNARAPVPDPIFGGVTFGEMVEGAASRVHELDHEAGLGGHPKPQHAPPGP